MSIDGHELPSIVKFIEIALTIKLLFAVLIAGHVCTVPDQTVTPALGQEFMQEEEIVVSLGSAAFGAKIAPTFIHGFSDNSYLRVTESNAQK